MSNILLTGGSGLLGTELQKLMKFDAPSEKEFNILDIPSGYKPDMIVHAAAYTDVGKAQNGEQGKCYNVNVNGTRNMLEAFPHIPFIYISTEYAHNPQTIYGVTKRAAEKLVEEHEAPCLVLRTLFKPNPFPFEKAFTDQYTQGDYVDIIAGLIVNEINHWDLRDDLRYVGTGRKTMYQLAKQTNPDVGKCSVDDFKDYPIPKDYE